MELKRHLDWRYVLAGLYAVVFLAYVVVGLQPAKAADYVKSAELVIPSIGLKSDVERLNVQNRKLNTPDEIVGSYTKAANKTLLVGHATTVFQKLNEVRVGDEIEYGGKIYQVSSRKFLAKAEIEMSRLLQEEEEDTLVLMTCAGRILDNGDATHRLIIVASI